MAHRTTIQMASRKEVNMNDRLLEAIGIQKIKVNSKD